MNISKVADIIHAISSGFEEAVASCMDSNKVVVRQAVTEQLYSGIDGNGAHLSPTYDADPFFNEEGVWFHRAADYKAWKYTITPPVSGTMLGLPPRPDDVPNLFINGKFYSEITVERSDKALHVDPGAGNGPDIVAKYGDQILNLAPPGVAYFNANYTWPAIKGLFERSGYK